MKKMVFGFALLLAALLLSTVAIAETYAVSPEGMSLTQALALCADGDIIELETGVYSEETEEFPLTVSKAVTLCAAEGAKPVIDAPAFQPAIRIEADGVTLNHLEILFRRTGIYALGDDMRMENCRISLADEAWRTSSCGMWCGGIYRMTVLDCDFVGCGISLAGPPLSESSAGKPVLTGLFEVGEDVAYFTSHTIQNCTVNGKPLFYAVSETSVTVPEDAGQIICCDCDEVKIANADVSDGSMGMVLAYNRRIELENCKADRCGVFGIYVAKCSSGTLTACSAAQTNHALDIRASQNMVVQACVATDCDQGLFFSFVQDSAMIQCEVTGTGQGYFMAGGKGNLLRSCTATDCENGFNLQKEGHVLMTDCNATRCTVCGVRLDGTPTAFLNNTMMDNWVAVMAYGDVSFDIADNLLDGSQCCALYLRDIGYSRFTGNVFTRDATDSVQAIGTLGGSLWMDNALDLPANLEQASDSFNRTV